MGRYTPRRAQKCFFITDVMKNRNEIEAPKSDFELPTKKKKKEGKTNAKQRLNKGETKAKNG